MRRLALVFGLLALAPLTVCACSDESAPAPLPEGGFPRSAPPPGSGGTGALPDGHPPIDDGQDPHAGVDMTGAGAQPRVPVPAQAMPLKWTVPEAWEETPPSSRMRLANYVVGKTEKGPPVECVIFAGIGGSDQDNLDRWIGFFTQADGSSSKDSAVITSSDRDGVGVTRMQLSGMFSGGMSAGGDDAVEWTMLAGIVRNKSLDDSRGRVFIRMQGPSDIVKAAAADFDAFLASMQPGAGE